MADDAFFLSGEQSLGTVSLSAEPAQPVTTQVQHSFPPPTQGSTTQASPQGGGGVGYTPPVALLKGASNTSSPAATPSQPQQAPQRDASMGSNQYQPGNSASEKMTQQIAGAVAGSLLDRARGVMRWGAGELRVYVEKNHYSVRVLSLMGGIALAGISSLHMLNILDLFTPLTYISHVFELMLGLVVCIIDGPGEKLPYALSLIQRYAPFLQTSFGPACFYLFLGCLVAAESTFVHVVLGYYFVFIAALHLLDKLRSFATGTPPQLNGAGVNQEGLLSYVEEGR